MSTTDPQFHTRNITRYFRSIDPAVIAEGREWYPKAFALAEKLAADYLPEDYDYRDDEWAREITKAAAVIAVLSPRLAWSKNVELAQRIYRWHAEHGFKGALTMVDLSWPGLKDGARKALKILEGWDVNETVKGPKVRQFWHTIVNPSDPRAVVVDRHAFAVAAGRVLTDEELGKYSGRLGTYDAVSEMYRRAAKILTLELEATITPAEVQAITWTAWRREHASKSAANRRHELGA